MDVKLKDKVFRLHVTKSFVEAEVQLQSVFDLGKKQSRYRPGVAQRVP